MNSDVTLILGGARSGKSTWAERLAARSGRSVIYLATATAGDDEMAGRIAAHRRARPASWRTVEAPDQLARALRAHARSGEVVLVDCLTLWVSNAILGRTADGAQAEAVTADEWALIEADLVTATKDFLDTARALDSSLILVSNEVGMGLVPPFPLGRRFRDSLGRINQLVASQADSVVLMIAGLPVDVRQLTVE